MKTDTIFYQLFQTFPSLLFELIGESPSLASNYAFSSGEIKELARRVDGIFLPITESPNSLIYFVEVQFQAKPDFYWRLFAEIAIYLNQYQPPNDWRAVAIFAARSLDPGVPVQYRAFLASQQLHQVYLDELEANTTSTLGVGIVRLVVADQPAAINLARSLITTTRESVTDAATRQKIMELLERILIYKFTELPTKEIEAMFTLEDLKKTRVYQEAKAEGEIEGEIKGKIKGKIEGKIEGKIDTIPLLLEAGFTVEVIADRLGLDLELVRLVAGGQAKT